MRVDIRPFLTSKIKKMEEVEDKERILVPDITLDTENIKIMMISEVTPSDSTDYFYSQKSNSTYIESALELFKASGKEFETIDDIVNFGIYITTAVKTPKIGYSIPTSTINKQLPILEAELDLFPNLRVIMLMGDVAKKAVNIIARKRTKKPVIPSESTYKIRHKEFYYNSIRVFPSYIMTGKNLLIEKSKVDMIVDDIQRALRFIEN